MTEKPPSPASSTLTYESGFDAVVARMNERCAPLSFAEGEALPALDIDFEPLKIRRIGPVDESDLPRAKDRSGHLRKSLELQSELEGAPELCWLNGLLIAHLRKTDQPAHCMALFTRLWTEESAFLIEHLDARWLISSLTTFGDHGQTPVQIRVGSALAAVFNTMKFYESERLYSGMTPDQPHRLKRHVTAPLPLRMDHYSLIQGGLDINLLGKIWEDASKDAVIAPLAHHLLNCLNSDDRNAFRRMAVLRGRRARQIENKAIARAEDWSIVCTTNAPRAQIKAFIDHHIALGATAIHIYLDTPQAPSTLAALEHPSVHLVQCDHVYWRANGRDRPEAHQLRQAFNANLAYKACQTPWLLHIDVDEFLHSDIPIREVLKNCPDDVPALVLPPAEELADAPGQEHLFHLPIADGADPSLDLREFYPTFGSYLPTGFLSHTEGKTIARTGLKNVRFAVHFLKQEGKAISTSMRSKNARILHRHAPDWDVFSHHLPFRRSHGSYRRKSKDKIDLAGILDVLHKENGADGPRLLFDEMCRARPELIAALDAAGLLIRTTLPEIEDPDAQTDSCGASQ